MGGALWGVRGVTNQTSAAGPYGIRAATFVGHSLGGLAAVCYLGCQRGWCDAAQPEGKRAVGLVLWSPVCKMPRMMPQVMYGTKVGQVCQKVIKKQHPEARFGQPKGTPLLGCGG